MASVIDQRTGAEVGASGPESSTAVTTERLRSLSFAKGTDQGPTHREPMSPRRRRTRYLVLAALLLVVIGYGFTQYKGILQPVIDVDVVAAESQLSTVTLLDTSGYLMAKTKVQVNSKIPGTIVELPIEEGMEVKAGDLLARLEGGEYAADLAAAKAGLAHSKAQLSELEAGARPEEVHQAESVLEQANARAEFARQGFERAKTLKDTISVQEFDRSKSNYDEAKAAVDQQIHSLALLKAGARPEQIAGAKAAVEQAQASLDKAAYWSESTYIRSPIAGTVLEKRIELGERIGPETIATGICLIGNLKAMEVEVDVQERELSNIKIGQPCRIEPEAYPNRLYKGRVGRIMPVANRQRGVVQIRVEVLNDDAKLLPGSESALATSWGTRYPIAQGPMTRVSDVASFAASVADHGALPFLALALLRGPNVQTLLAETKQRLGKKSWGVGILGFVPQELRKEQLAVVLEAKPKFTIIAGGRPSQAAELEKAGIATYLHVPSPGLLSAFIRDGSRKFIFEGRECGGHVGPRTSFVLWQSAIDVLLETKPADLANIEVLFAGGIHDQMSAAMVAVLAAPLVERGVKIGVLMGTSYLFTPEAVACGAITREFQEQAIRCDRTALLESGAGHATRCVPSPFAEEFQQKKRELVAAGKESADIRMELEVLNVGRLRLASKGVTRAETPTGTNGSGLTAVDVETQRRMGMYMIGDVATLRTQVIGMQELHEQVTTGGVDALARQAKRSNSIPATAKAARVGEPLAIVGMGCMLPESGNIRRYWQNIFQRFDAIKEVPADRWRVDDFFSANRLERDRVYSKWGSFLEQYRFDPMKYRIPPAAVASIEPIQLLALEVAEQALDDAGYRFDGFPRERTAVIFAAAGTHDVGLAYAFRTMMRHHLPMVEGLSNEVRDRIYTSLESQLPEWTEDSFAGFLLNVVAGRIANRFDLRGPNFTVDAACASSMAAVQTAAEQLRSGSCDAALVGAVDGTNNPFCFMSFAKTHALSPRGKSRPYDKNADGIGLGEGLGAVVLKRLPDALRDGDRVYAVIRGIGGSSDGRNRSMTAPFPDGQVLALRRAYEDAGMDPSTVSLVEAHSTGTSVGDRVELEALQKVFPARNGSGRTCAIGSVKSNLGHAKTSAGLASLIKTALALKHRVLPPTIGVETPNEQFTTSGCPFYVNTDNRPWFRDDKHPKRRAGVSAFGFGGTNFHVVLEEHDDSHQTAYKLDFQPRDSELFLWQANDRATLLKQVEKFAADLPASPSADLAQLAFSLSADWRSARTPGSVRCAVVASSFDDLRQKCQKLLEQAAKGGDVSIPTGAWLSASAASDYSDTCFLFPGQGSQSLNMLKDLVLSNAWSYDRFEEADSQLAEYFPEKLSTVIYPQSKFEAADQKAHEAELNDTRAAQPALGITGVFAHDLLGRYGVHPAFVAGHSYGEYVALWAAGCIDWDNLIQLSGERGRLAHAASQQNGGTMAAVVADADTTARHLRNIAGAELANLNAEDQTVIAGPTAAIDKAVAHFASVGIQAKKISVTAAFHTSALQEASEALASRLGAININIPQLSVYSNSTAEKYPSDLAAIRQVLANHIAKPVRFREQIGRMHADGARLFIEVGAGSVLTRLVGRILRDKQHKAIALDGGVGSNWTQFGKLLGQLFVAGKPVTVESWFENRGLQSISVADYLAELRNREVEKPTDWMLSPGGARQVGKPKTQPNKLANGKATQPIKVTNQPTPVTRAATNGAHRDVASNGAGQKKIVQASSSQHQVSPRLAASSNTPQLSKGRSMLELSHTNGESSGNALSVVERSNGIANGHVVASHDALGQFQAVMGEWLKLQQGQMRLNERFLETQENVMRASLGFDAPARVKLLNSSNGSTPTASPAIDAPVVRPQMGLAVAPAPVLPSLNARAPQASPADQLRAVVSTQEAVVVASPTKPVAPPVLVQKAPANVAAPASDDSSNNSSGQYLHTTEEFREALLNAVSERTGYPLDMLDENAALEAELGIDSIKTVEIFSSLSQFHAFLPGSTDDQDETINSFAQLKTLRDIVNVYDKRRAEQLAPSSSSEATAASVNGATTEPATNGRGDRELVAVGTVERFTVEAVAAPQILDSKKKPSLETISS